MCLTNGSVWGRDVPGAHESCVVIGGEPATNETFVKIEPIDRRLEVVKVFILLSFPSLRISN